MKSFIAALRSLVLPYGRTTGPRIVLDGVNGRIEVYDAGDDLVYLIDALISGATAGVAGEPQVIIYSNGVNGVAEFPTGDANEIQPARIGSVVYNRGTPTERLAFELQGASHDVDSNRIAMQFNSTRANSSTPVNVQFFDIATQDLLLYIAREFVQVSEPLQVEPEASASAALHVGGAAGHTGPLIHAQLNGADRLTVAANGDTAIAGSVTAANIKSGTAQTPAPGGAPAQTSVAVAFGTAMPAVPRVVVTPNSAAANLDTSNIRWAVTNVTVNGFTINCWRDTNNATNFEWFAHV